MTTETQTNQTDEPDIIVEPADNELDTQDQGEGRYRDPETGRFAKKQPDEYRLERRDDPRERIAEAFAKARKDAEAEGEAEQMPVPKKMWAGMSDEEVSEQAGMNQEEPEPAPEPEPEPEPAKAAEPVPLTIVVDGNVAQVDRNDPRWAAPGMTDEQVRAVAQMYWATQARLHTANQYLDKAKGQGGEPSADQSGAPLSATEPSADGTSETKLIDPDKIGEIVDKLQLGNRDEAQEALADLVKSLVDAVGPQRPAPDIDQQVQHALVARENQNEIDRAISDFEKDNSDIAGNKYLAQTVLDMTVDLMKDDMRKLGVTDEVLSPNGKPLPGRMVAAIYRNMRLGGLPMRSHAEVLGEAAGKLRQTFNLPRAPKPNEADQGTIQQRLAQKRQMQSQPRSAGVRGAQGQQPRPQTSAEVIRDMRKARMPWLGA